MPGSFQPGGLGGVPNTAALPPVRTFVSSETPYFEYPYAISGITKDATGAALPACALVLFRTADNSVAAVGVSDANGNYRLGASPALTHFLVEYKAGAPDVAGTSVNTLVGA